MPAAFTASYYQCAGYTSNPATGKCYSPSTVWKERETNSHQSHELRLSTPDDKRLRALVGVYWEDYKITDQTQWTYVTVPTCSPTGLNVDCFLPIQPWPGSPAFTPNPPTGFFDDVERGYKQLAEFASVDFDVIPKVVTLTGAIRHFKYDDSERGGDVGSFGCKQFTARPRYFGPCLTPDGTNLDTRAPNRSTPSGNRARGNLSWHVTEDALLYYTWSQGFRAGQFNRSTSCHLPGPDKTRSVLRSRLHGAGQHHQQRGRLEDAMVRQPRASERRHLPGSLEQCADGLFRSAGRSRKSGFCDQRTELPGPGVRALRARARDSRLDRPDSPRPGTARRRRTRLFWSTTIPAA